MGAGGRGRRATPSPWVAVPGLLAALVAVVVVLGRGGGASVGRAEGGTPRAPASGAPVHADPDVVRAADGRFLSFGTSGPAPAGPARIPVLVSDDLRTWTAAGDALPVPGRWASAARDPVWAPSMTEIGGTHVLYYSAVHAGLGVRCVGRALAAVPEGPYLDDAAEPLVCPRPPEYEVIDPSVHVEAGGTPYLAFKTSARAAAGIVTRISVVELTPDGRRLAGSPAPLLDPTQPWEEGGVENPEMVLVAGRHWLFYSAGWWDTDGYSTGVARCDGPTGPCRSHGRLLATAGGVRGPGGASLVRDATVGWWIAYHAWEGDARVLHVDPLSFDGGRPEVLAAWRSPRATPPFGAVEWVGRAAGGIRVRGWAADPDGAGPLDVVVTVDGVEGVATRAGEARPDPTDRGGGRVVHGFDATVAVPPGPPVAARVCATAVNDGPGPDTDLGCREVWVPREPPAAGTWWDRAVAPGPPPARALLRGG